MSQMSFSDAEYADKRMKTRRKEFLAEMERVIPWVSLLELIGLFVSGRWAWPASLSAGDNVAGSPAAELVRVERVRFSTVVRILYWALSERAEPLSVHCENAVLDPPSAQQGEFKFEAHRACASSRHQVMHFRIEFAPLIDCEMMPIPQPRHFVHA